MNNAQKAFNYLQENYKLENLVLHVNVEYDEDEITWYMPKFTPNIYELAPYSLTDDEEDELYHLLANEIDAKAIYENIEDTEDTYYNL